MAIVVKTYPGEYSSVHGDLIYVVHEATKANDPVTYPDYRYIADVYAGSEHVARLKAYPQPDTKMGIFNLSNIFRNYITPVFNPLANTFEAQTLDAGDFNVSGTVIFGEEYNFSLYPAMISGVGRKMFGHYNARLLGVLTNLTAYYGKIASVRPDRTSVYRNAANNFIPFFNDTTPGSLLITGYPSNSSTFIASIGGADKSMTVYNVSPSVINSSYAPTVLDTDEYYTLEFENNRMLTIDIVCEPKFTVYTLHFLNRFGGFESRDFTKLSRKGVDIERKDFGKLPYTVNASGEVSYKNANNVYNETRSVYSSQYKEKMVLNTDIVTDEEYTWLADLVLSPMVYMEMEGYFIPVVITQNNYEFKKVINDKLTNLTVDIEFGDQFNAQYR